MGPSSVVTLTGPEHMRQRKLLLPPFHGERMRDYEDVIAQATRNEMASWPIGSPMRVQPGMRRITLEVILRAVFGVEADRMGPMRGAIGDSARARADARDDPRRAAPAEPLSGPAGASERHWTSWTRSSTRRSPGAGRRSTCRSDPTSCRC